MGTTAEKLTYLNTTKGKIKDSINLTGANITTEPFRQYSTKLNSALLDILNNGTQEVWDNWEKVSASNVTSASLNQTVEAPMKLDLKGNTSQEGTPTPDNPKDIHIVSGDNSIDVCGKNLFDKSNVNIINGYLNTNIITPSDSARTLYISCLPNTTYTVSRTVGARFAVAYTSTIPQKNTLISGFKRANTATSITITTENDANYLCVYYYSSSYDTLTEEEIINSIQIELGNQATTYTPYVSQTYPINLGSIELCKIGDYQDRIFKAIEGDNFYDTLDSATKQTLDTGDWYKYGAIGKVVLDGSEDEDIRKSTDAGYTRYSIVGISDLLQYVGRNDIYGNYFHYKSSGREVGVCFAYWVNNGSIYIYPEQTITEITDLRTWLSTHNTIFYYPLQTPTYTKITGDLIGQLEAIKKSYNEQTNLSQTPNDLPFILDLTALKEI